MDQERKIARASENVCVDARELRNNFHTLARIMADTAPMLRAVGEIERFNLSLDEDSRHRVHRRLTHITQLIREL